MRRVIALSVSALLTGVALLAQGGGGAAPAGPAQTCAPNGYGAQGYYSMFVQNDDGFTAFEIASPCIGKDVREVAESIGMGRGKVMSVKNVIGVQFRADGTMADGTGMARPTNAEFHIAYYLPAMRMFLNGTKANGQPLKEIRVFADQYAWDEAQEGRGALQERRRGQARAWLWERIDAGLRDAFRGHAAVRARLDATLAAVDAGRLPVSVAARRLLDAFVPAAQPVASGHD